jgi:subtilisin family serine protease
VVKVFKNRMHRAETVSTPRYLGLSGNGGVWNKHVGGEAGAGQGVIVGVLDSGFWPENPSFAAMPEPRPDHDVIAAKWRGICDAGAEAPLITCNNKVIGARWYNEGGVGDDAEFYSPRDRNGHGSHTASTAAGVPAEMSIAGANYGRGSGMAPAARLAVYKVLWNTSDAGTIGTTVDIVHATEDAVSDGVDVINYSLSDGPGPVGPAEIATFHAAAAGVFVAAAGANGDPTGGFTVDNVEPWVTTVANGTHDGRYTRTITLGNGASYEGVGLGPATASGPLVDAEDMAAPGASASDAALCLPGTLDPARVTGKIVICDRGINARVEKSAVVEQAGGVGMVLYNVVAGSLNADIHAVPTVHVATPEGDAIAAYVESAGAGATATIGAGRIGSQRAPAVNPTSLRGPATFNDGDLLKPDILAPGTDILAASPPISTSSGSDYALRTGTSQAAPHIAGIAALLKQKHPTWSPNAIQSALLTSANPTDNTGAPILDDLNGAAASPLAYGAGQVTPAGAFDPGLVYDSGPQDWIRYQCGLGVELFPADPTRSCKVTGAIDPSDLNYPSISIGNLVGRQTVTRTVTNVTDRAGVYTPQIQAPPGVAVTVTPSRLTVAPHRTAQFTVEFTAQNTARWGEWTFGSLTLVEANGHRVRSPIAVRPQVLVVPDSLTGTGTSGSIPLRVQAGFTGTLTTTAYGPVAVNPPTRTDTVHIVGTAGIFIHDAPHTGTGVQKVTVDLPDARAINFATRTSDLPPGSDVDLFVYRNGKYVDSSVGLNPEDGVAVAGGGRYEVYVLQWALPAGVSEQDVSVHTTVATAATGNLTVTPAITQVTPGATVNLTANWTGLTADTPYIGAIVFTPAVGLTSSTPVRLTG